MGKVFMNQAIVAAVDPCAADYADVEMAVESSGINFRWMPTAVEAMRHARRCGADLWVINSNLPDRSGFDLAEMLRRMEPGARVIIVSDRYNVDDEIETLALGLLKYACKPIEPSWILTLMTSISRRRPAA